MMTEQHFIRRQWLALTPARVTLLVIFCVALLLRLYRLDAQSLWLDEGGTWAEVTGRTGKGWLVLIGELFSSDASYPLYHVLLKAWVSIAGDSEWALRLPSALFGALAVVVMVVAAAELWAPWTSDATPARSLRLPAPVIMVGLLVACSPYALWHAQDAKAYSLLFLFAALLNWRLLCTLRQGSRRNWLVLIGLALVSMLVHRLAFLLIAGGGLAIALGYPLQRRWRIGGIGLALACAAIGLAGTIRAAATERAVIGRSAVAPLESLWLTLVRFSLDRWPGDINGYLLLPTAIWLMPALLLGLWGTLLLVRDAGTRQPQAIALLCVFVVPMVLLAILLAFAPVYESRYAMVAFPAWLLICAYPLLRQSGPNSTQYHSAGRPVLPSWGLSIALLLVSSASLFQPAKGLFSGDPLKEQWREAVADIAQRAHPDDLLLIHPYYVAEMYAYYAGRVTPDPLPQPVTFPVFAEGDTCGTITPAELRACWQRRYEPFFNAQAFGKKRALLLIAPDHARTVDPPKTLAELRSETPAGQSQPTEGDRYGWVGLRFQYPQKTWPCGGTDDALIGVAVMCQSFPETYNAGQAGEVPQPDLALDAVFGAELRLRGVSFNLRGGMARPGGALPITLYWAADALPTHNYRMFLHLCRDCEQPPLANDDAPPLAGYAPAGQTTTWVVGDPLHDERSIRLPADLPPGRYTILLGVYYGDGAPATRLRITGVAADRLLSADRLVLGQIDIQSSK